MQEAKQNSQKYPLITVVIPAFNEERYLPDCLSALKKQTYPRKNYEVIVVDNNSTDRTPIIAKKFEAKVIREKKQGYVFALDKGMKNTRGEIIAVTDADTKVSNNWLARIAKVFEDKDIVGVTGSATIDTRSKIANLLVMFFYTFFLKVTFALGKPNLSGINIAIRKSAYGLVNGIDTHFKMSPDVDLGLRLKSVGEVKFEKDLFVVTSARRFRKGILKAIFQYAKGYIFVSWLRRPPAIEQTVVR